MVVVAKEIEGVRRRRRHFDWPGRNRQRIGTLGLGSEDEEALKS